ncbi:MAG: class II fumarate hydratase [Phycisphaerae bacterium]
MANTRTERDSMGEMEVPADALYGASTQRAVLNFPISGLRFGRIFIHAMGLTKYACAMANESLGKLDAKVASAIKQAAREVADGKHDDAFVVDIYQTGSGTSTNMNANEVIANRAMQIAGDKLDTRIHPNDHVNMGQSSNDVIPTVAHVAVTEALHHELMPHLHRLHKALKAKSQEFANIVKMGRTHLMDATPIMLGQQFSGYASQISHADRRVLNCVIKLRELPIGGTAVGTGINTHPEFAKRVCEILNHETNESFHEAPNHFEAQAANDAMVEVAAVLKTVAISIAKIANDVRMLASGPRSGLGEINLPEIQPGSSIMPGKVNPVICESVIQVAAQVVGCDATVSFAGAMLSNFELHTGHPVIARNILEAVRILGNACDAFVDKCITGMTANEQRCGELVERSLAMCTSLAPEIGYDAAADIAKEAFKSGKSVREVAKAKKLMDDKKLEELLDAKRMTTPS